MGKYKHEGKGRNISIGGGKERADLFKDMSGGYNAMGDSNKPSPIYNYGGNSVAKRYSPMKKALVGDQNQLPDHLVKAIKAAPEMKGSPVYKTGCVSGSGSKAPYKMMGDPNKKMDRLSAKHKSLYDRFEMGQTSEKEEQRMFRLEDRMDKVGKKIKSKKSPLNQGTRSSKRQSRPDVSTLGEKEFEDKLRKERRLPGFAERPGGTQLQESAKKRTSDPDYKKPKAKTLKKSPLNQGVKEMSDAEMKKMLKEKGIKPGDIKSKKALSISEKPKDKKKKDIIKSKNKKVIKATKKKMTTARGKTTSTKKTMTTGRGKTTKSPLNQGIDADAEKLRFRKRFKPGVKADEDRTKKDKRKHKRTMKKLGRLTKKIVKNSKNTSKK